MHTKTDFWALSLNQGDSLSRVCRNASVRGSQSCLWPWPWVRQDEQKEAQCPQAGLTGMLESGWGTRADASWDSRERSSLCGNGILISGNPKNNGWLPHHYSKEFQRVAKEHIFSSRFILSADFPVSLHEV